MSRYSLTSEVWKYITRVSCSEALCKTCLRSVATSGNTKNAWKHLATHHSIYPASASKENQPPSVCVEPEGEVDDPGEFDDNEIVSSPGTPTLHTPRRRTAVSAARIGRKRQASSLLIHPHQATIEGTFKRARTYEDGGVRAAALDHALAYMVAKDHLSLSTPENIGFRRFASVAVPLWQPPSRQKLTRMIEAKYTCLKQQVREAIAAVPALSLTFDIWTESHTTSSFLGGSAHFLSGTAMESVCLSVSKLSTSHTSDNVKAVIEETIEDFGINKKQVALCVTDNANNIRRAVMDIFGEDKTVGCFDHTLNLIPKAAIGQNSRKEDIIPGMPAMLDKVKDIVAFFHRSTKASDELKRLQYANGHSEGTALRLVQSVETRWSSEYYMLVRFLELADIIGVVLLKFPEKNMLTGSEIAFFRTLADLLEPFAKATEEMSADSTTTVSKVIPVVRLLKQCVNQVEIPENEPLLRRVKQFMLSDLDRRFASCEKNKIFASACLLDPRFKQLHFQSPLAHANAVTRLSSEMRIMFRSENEQAAPLVSLPQQPTQRTSNVSLWDLHDSMVASQVVNREEDMVGQTPVELRQYLNRPLAERKANPFVLWEGLKSEYPHVHQLAMKALPLVATSVPSERIFSEAHLIMTPLRSRLSAEHFNQLLFLASVSDALWFSLGK